MSKSPGSLLTGTWDLGTEATLRYVSHKVLENLFLKKLLSWRFIPPFRRSSPAPGLPLRDSRTLDPTSLNLLPPLLGSLSICGPVPSEPNPPYSSLVEVCYRKGCESASTQNLGRSLYVYLASSGRYSPSGPGLYILECFHSMGSLVPSLSGKKGMEGWGGLGVWEAGGLSR